MSKITLITLLLFISKIGFAQTESIDSLGGIDFYVHKEVTNSNGEIEQQLIRVVAT